MEKQRLLLTVIITAIIVIIAGKVDYETRQAESIAKYGVRLEQEQIRLTNLLHNQN